MIIAVYVDDLNLIGTPEEIQNNVEYLKKDFEIKNFGKTKFYLDLQIEHLKSEIFIHQTAYIRKVLKQFSMDKAYILNILMVVGSLDPNKDPFRSREEDEEILGPEVLYLSAIDEEYWNAMMKRSQMIFA